MLGIGGVGMAGLAYHLAKAGIPVSGCDREMNPLVSWLQSEGVTVQQRHDASHIDRFNPEWIIRSTAVHRQTEELLGAEERGLPVFRRGEVLSALVESFSCVAVTGTHGKSTTSSLVAHALQAAGRDASYCIGAETGRDGRVAYRGEDDTFVIEADESDGTAALYHPSIGIITNIEYDHMEHFSSEEAFVDVFRHFARQATRRLVYCGDDRLATAIGSGQENALSYGLSNACALQAYDLDLRADSSVFSIRHGQTELGRCVLSLPGQHNVLNTLAAIATAMELGLDMARVIEGFAEVTAPRRRFETIAEGKGIRVISDYAHHPTEIRAVIETAKRQGAARLLAVFQPHRYTRTSALGSEFPPAFEGIDQLFITPVYAASEEPIAGGTSKDLLIRFKETGMTPADYVSSLEDAWSSLEEILREGDILLVIGAGDVEKIAGWAATYVTRPVEEKIRVAAVGDQA